MLNSHRWRKMVHTCSVMWMWILSLPWKGQGLNFCASIKKQNRVVTHSLIHLHVNLLHSIVAWTASPITYKMSSWIWLYINDSCGLGSQIYSKLSLVLVLANFPNHVWMEAYWYFHTWRWKHNFEIGYIAMSTSTLLIWCTLDFNSPQKLRLLIFKATTKQAVELIN